MQKTKLPPKKLILWNKIAAISFWLMIGVMMFSAIPSAYQSAWDYRQMRQACLNYPDIVYTCQVACPLFNEKEGLELANWTEYYNQSFQRPKANAELPFLVGMLNVTLGE